MPLLVNEIVLNDLHEIQSTSKLYERYPTIADHLTGNRLNDEMIICDTDRMAALYVMQHEYAIVSTLDGNLRFKRCLFNNSLRCLLENIDLVLTDDTTTCVTGILSNQQTKLICLCHFDRIQLEYDIQTFDQVCRQMSSMSDHIDQFELTLIGGYLDENNISEKLVMSILSMFHFIEYNIHLKFVYVGQLNTKIGYNDSQRIAQPKLSGVSVTLSNGELHQAILNRKTNQTSMVDYNGVPLQKLRQMFCSFRSPSMKQYLSIYDHETQTLRIPPLKFNRSYFTRNSKIFFEEILKSNDQDILNHFSTSPMVEPEHFVSDMRMSFKYIYDHICQFGFDSGELITKHHFPNGKARTFRLVQDKNVRLSPEERTSKHYYIWQEIFH